jgi:L-amino acid N-acyltransferase YncA
MRIRKAEERDIGAILAMLEKFWALTHYAKSGVPFDEESSFSSMMMSYEQGMLIVAEDDGVIGFAGGIYTPLLGNYNYRMGIELSWWIEEEHRNAGSGQKLLEGLEGVAKENGVDFWNMVTLEGASPEAAEHMYARNGYKKTETTFLKEL